MREIGGYIELETLRRQALHEELIGLGSGRSCLDYLVKTKGIRAIALPYFLCSSVKERCRKLNLRVRYYEIDESLLPADAAPKDDEWLYVVNFYGQLRSEEIRKLKDRYGRIIVDNAQAFFEEPCEGTDTIYTCRKYFGVPDGAWLSTDVKLGEPLMKDRSAGRMGFLLGRFEGNASDYYDEYAANNASFRDAPLHAMSSLTLNLLRAIDYEDVKRRRTENFRYLHAYLADRNQLSLKVPGGAFAYPFMTENAGYLRKEMIRRKIYIPLLWPNVPEEAPEGSFSLKMAASVLPLPCDQRYGEEEMEYMYRTLLEIMDNTER